MSADPLSIRLSDVRHADRGMSSSKSPSSCSSMESSLSVSDARKRFEQLSASTSQVPLSTTKPPRPNKPPVKKARSIAVVHSTSDNRIHKGQRSPDHTNNACSIEYAGNSSIRKTSTPEQEVDKAVGHSDSKEKLKAKALKKSSGNSTASSMDKTGSRPGTPGSGSEGGAAGESGSRKLSIKLFKRITTEKGKADSTGEGRSGGGARVDSSAMSPSSSRKRLGRLRTQESGTSSKGSTPTTSPTRSPKDKQLRRRSFSDQVLVSPNHEVIVHTTLKREASEAKITGGARPSSPRVIEDKELKINLTEDMTPLSGAELKAILNKQYACISGGLEGGKHLIITFPDVGLRHLDGNSEGFSELLTTLVYFKTLISVQHLNAGFTVLMDAHSSKTHSCTKQILERMAAKGFPLSVHMVYIFMKSGLFGRSKNLASSEVSSKLHLACFVDTKSLVDQLGAENLTPELGGNMQYDHSIWVTNRLEFEKVQVLHRHAMASVPEVTEALNVCSVPGTIKEAEHLMQEDLKLKENLVNRVTEAELNIDSFVSSLDRQGSSEGVELGAGAGNAKDYMTMRNYLDDLLVELRTSLSKFDAFWLVHKARVDHMMRMCHFKKTAATLQKTIGEFKEELTSGGLNLGDSLETSLEQGEKHEVFVTKIKNATEEEVNHMREDATVLTNPRFNSGEMSAEAQEATKSAVENVKATLDELNDSYKELTTLCQQKRDLFIVCVKFHMTTRQCLQWSQDVLEFLASQPIEAPSYKQANHLIGRIDEFLSRVQPVQIQSLQDLVSALPDERTFQKSMHKTIHKYEHTCELLNKRKMELLKLVTAMSSPHPSKKDKKKHKEKPEIELLNSHDPQDDTLSISSSTVTTASPEASLFLTKTMAEGLAQENTDGETSEATRKSRGFIFKELVATENDYIRDLMTIIDSYYDAMEEGETIPLRLRGKRNVIFGNLPEIYNFHDTLFVKALQQFEENPHRVGEIFIQFTEEFQMYSTYCKNRSNSEALLSEHPENEAFFKTIQLNLSHQLPLNSYLLKPVQRITKYQLLLKDMMKHSVNAPKAHADLQKALDRMLKVLKNLNDSLHVVGLKGFPGALAEQGRLLVHDAFSVWDGHGNPSRSIFARSKERHVFLFERVIIMSKKFEAPSQKKAQKADNYLYKAHLPLADVTMREKVDNQPLQFTLSVHRQNKDFKFQAQTKEIHSMWTTEVRRLLQDQFSLVKDMVIKSGTLDRRTYRGNAGISRDSRLFGDSFKVKHDSKKSKGGRFNLLKRKKLGVESSKGKKAVNGNGVNPEASLLSSCSVPPNVKFGLRGAGSADRLSPLIQAQPASLSSRTQPKLSDSVSSDEDFFSEASEEEEEVEEAAVDHYESLAPGAPRHYTAISPYSPGDSDDNGVALVFDQQVEVIGINQYGWWWVRATNPTNGEVEEGWVPASYLKVKGEDTEEDMKS